MYNYSMKDLAQKILGFIDRTLKTPVTPLAYLVTLHSLIFAGSFVLFGETTAVQATLLWKIGALIGVQAWGILALVAAILCLYGLIRRQTWFVNAGSFGLFAVWLFAAIAYFLSGFWLQGALALVTMNYFGYFNMAASLGRLWNYKPY